MRNVGVVDPYAISQKNKTLIDKENNMSRLIVKAWDVVDGVIDASRNTTNSTDTSLNLENKIVNLYQGRAIVYTSKEFIRNLIVNATSNLIP